MSAEKGYRHFFYGSTQETLDRMREVLEKDYPGVQIAGMYSPPFRTLSVEEDLEIIQMINESHADEHFPRERDITFSYISSRETR